MATLGILGIYGDEAGLVSRVVEIKLCLVVVAGKLIGCVGILGVEGADGDALYESHKKVVIHVGVDGKEGSLRGHCRDLRHVDGTNGHTAVSPVNFFRPLYHSKHSRLVDGIKNSFSRGVFYFCGFRCLLLRVYRSLVLGDDGLDLLGRHFGLLLGDR